MKTALRILLGLLLTLLALPALGTAAFFAVGPERVWTVFLGSPDQGAIDFATLERRATPTDSLACTVGLCAARTDIVLPTYPDAPAALMARLDAVVLADAAHLSRVDDGTHPAYRRYVARTSIMRYPDTIDALAEPLGTGSGLMLYGRSQIGSGDWGVNRARIEAWIANLPAPARTATSETPTS